jgi:hypothetical protein
MELASGVFQGPGAISRGMLVRGVRYLLLKGGEFAAAVVCRRTVDRRGEE